MCKKSSDKDNQVFSGDWSKRGNTRRWRGETQVMTKNNYNIRISKYACRWYCIRWNSVRYNERTVIFNRSRKFYDTHPKYQNYQTFYTENQTSQKFLLSKIHKWSDWANMTHQKTTILWTQSKTHVFPSALFCSLWLWTQWCCWRNTHNLALLQYLLRYMYWRCVDTRGFAKFARLKSVKKCSAVVQLLNTFAFVEIIYTQHRPKWCLFLYHGNMEHLHLQETVYRTKNVNHVLG